MLEIFTNRADPKYQLLIAEGIEEKNVCFEVLEEYFAVENSGQKNITGTQIAEFIKHITNNDISNYGVRVYYPWLGKILHVPPKEIFNKVRISRNRNLITPQEQSIFQAKTIGICGMSVGSNVLRTLTLIGGPRRIKIADHDRISVSNLNRIFAPVFEVNSNKAEFFAKQALEMDPFLKIKVYSEGINNDNINDFLDNPRIDLLIEETDNPVVKINIRKTAQKLGIPVIMAADNGDGAIVEVERYDQKKSLEIFNGRLKSLKLNQISENISFANKMMLIAAMVGLKDADIRALSSLLLVGKELNTWPQLGTAAVTVGAALSVVARRILLGMSMPSGRYFINYEEHFQPRYNALINRVKRKIMIKNLIQKIMSPR